MEQRRLLAWVLFSFLFILLWQKFVAPPRPPVNVPPADAVVADATPEPDEAAPPTEDVPVFESSVATLGSLDPASGYFLQVELTSRGAAIAKVRLNDPRYRDLDDREAPLTIVGNRDADRRTLAMYAASLDQPLASLQKRLDTYHWELVEADETHAVFRFPAIAGQPELVKTFRVNKGEDRDGDLSGYLVDVELMLRNPGESPVEFAYVWQGPVSVPLENLESTRTFIELKGGFVPPGDDEVEVVNMTAADVVEEYDDALDRGEPGSVTRWREPPRFVGIDVQYFAALLTPADDDRSIDFVKSITPIVVEREKTVQRSDVSLTLEAKSLTLPPGGEQRHAMRAFFGPKRSDLLDAMEAGDVIAFGFFGSISRVMLAVLGFFHHSMGLPYAMAIIALTCCVRLMMTPITLKQASQARKMKEMQPKLAALQEKYGDDKEGLLKAQLQLQRDENFNMFAGCLPVLLQFPIFIGLYNALYQAIDLRLASFLWVDNLAAPDHLAPLPVTLPFLGSWLNLLPILTCGLFIVQQKLFMPPAATEEQQVQQSMMKWMMVLMGFFFYHVPAGLCLYFIASSLWSMTERKLIDADIIRLPERKKKPKKPSKGPGLMGRLLEMADEAKKQQQAAERGR